MENWNWTNFCGKDGFYIWSPTQNDFGVCFQSLFLHIPILSVFGVISAYYLGLERSYISRTAVQNYSLIIRSIISVILAFTPILEIFLKISLNEHKAGAASLLLLIIQGICWFVHFLYVLRLKKGISKNPRGPMLICIVWSFLFALNLLATRSQFILYKTTDIESEIFGYNIIILHIGYALTMIPGLTEENRNIESSDEYTSLINSSVRFELDNDTRYLGEALEREKCFSRIFFTWVNALIDKGAEDDINNSDDLFDLPNSISTKYNSVKLGQYLIDNNEPINQKYSLIKALHKAYAWEFYSVGILKFIADCCGFAGPILLNKLVTFIENKSEDMIYGYLYAIGLIFSTAMAALCDTHFNFLVGVVGLKMRGALITTIYKKTLLIRSTIFSSYLSFGEIVNFMSTDTDRIVNACPSFHSLWSVPFQISVTLYLLYQQVGIAFLAGLIFSIILIPINKIIANKIGELSSKMMKYKDERVKLTSEVLIGYKAIKLYVWEEHFIREITKKRDIELKYLKGRKYLDALCVYFWATTPVIISILTIGTYVLLGNKLTAAGIFTTIALLNMLVSPLNAFPWVLNGLTEAWVSIKRIQKLLDLNSMNYNEIYNNSLNNDDSNNDIIIKNGLFSWGNKNNERHFELNNINFEIKQGEFIAIIGPVGSGKSTFLASILGELTTESGNIGLKEISSGFGIVTQQPWLQRGSIRDNILFGKPYNESKYNSILFSCGLEEDIKNLPEGDLTVIGDGGGTLSGGQKTRIALARAVYQDKNVYLFDDILSAVDVKVAKHIFQYCLLDLLKNKTRILCTHHLKYLNNVDKIVVLENGLLKVIGVPGEILENDSLLIENTDNISSETHFDEINFINNKTEDNDFMDEKSERGNLKFSVYISYWKSIGTTISIFIIISMIFMQLSRNLTDWWLASQVTAQEQNSTNLTNYILINSDSENMKLFLWVYIGFAVTNTIFTLIRAFIFAYGGISAAKKIHKSLLRTVLKGISKFFYFTPTGTIINRFSSDTYTIDDSLPFILNILLAQMFGLLGCICITVYGLPWICIVLIPMVPIYTWLMNQYRITSRELKRISSVTLSPVYNHFNETLQGLINIRAMRAMNRFQIENEDKVEANLKAQFASQSAARWLGLRLQFISVAIITGVSVIAVIQHQYQVANPGFIGLAISYALSITGSLAGVVNAFTETEREMIAVERVKQYIEIVPCETEFFIMDPPFAWPTLSVIKFENVVLHYRKNSNPSLNNISFETRPSEKIGIVGRTGAGKSSILTALFRLVDLSSGSIYVDNIDIKKLSIKALRSRLFCIPQDPFLFSGTIRENLDPLNEFSDVEINDTLKRFKLIEILNNLGGLDCVINGSGTNLSVGQKQLICLCRAVLRNPRILCIDEATANVDEETDKIIQSTLRIAFSTSTVLTIAHRIQTVYDSDRVLVINHGQIMEFDKPDILLANPDSYFCKLVKEI